MSDNTNSGSDFLGGLLASAGFAVMLIAPFYLARRFGIHVLAGIVAVFLTILALISNTLVAMAHEVDCGIRCVAAPGATMILAMEGFGWWRLAGISWLAFLLILFLPLFVHQQPETASTNKSN